MDYRRINSFDKLGSVGQRKRDFTSITTRDRTLWHHSYFNIFIYELSQRPCILHELFIGNKNGHKPNEPKMLKNILYLYKKNLNLLWYLQQILLLENNLSFLLGQRTFDLRTNFSVFPSSMMYCQTNTVYNHETFNKTTTI